jgi:hypothetical protein
MSNESASMKFFSFPEQKKACSTGDTQGVTILTGDPKKAIISLSGPMIIAMLLMSSYNVVNAIWVVGLGSDALAASHRVHKSHFHGSPRSGNRYRGWGDIGYSAEDRGRRS